MEEHWAEDISICQDSPGQLPHGEVPLHPMNSADSRSIPIFPTSLHSLILPLLVHSVDEKLNKYIQNRKAAVCICIAVQAILIYIQKYMVRVTGVQPWHSSKHTDLPENINTSHLAKLILLSMSD